MEDVALGFACLYAMRPIRIACNLSSYRQGQVPVWLAWGSRYRCRPLVWAMRRDSSWESGRELVRLSLASRPSHTAVSAAVSTSISIASEMSLWGSGEAKGHPISPGWPHALRRT